MFQKLHQGYSRSSSVSSAPYLAPPIEGTGQIFTFTPVPIDSSASDYHQPWDGYVPSCTLTTQTDCQYFPAQTANIKVQDIYTGIEVEGDDWMQMACQAAQDSVGDNGGPFGAVILQIDDTTNQIIRYWVNHNQVTSTNDPTAHAEVMTIRSACASLGVFNLGCIQKADSLLSQPNATSHCVIYSSAEPCPMCYSAICWANLPMLLFGATRFDAAVQGVNFSDEAIYEELEKPYSERNMKVYQCTVDNSLDAFNLWKRSEKTPY
ncbi:TPA: nucleoside deaminase [Candidatus Sumerlaeota bacterium]|nr:nucleoside deaminase [Candidatus Sumerlaeota bacterium]